VEQDTPILMLYDGQCGFCNGTVQWLLKHDRFDRFRFAPQQSAAANEIFRRHGVHRDTMLASNSVYLVLDQGKGGERLLQRSDVMVRTLWTLGGFWRFLGHCFKLVPRFVRDAGYTLVARNRFRIGERYDRCPIPTAAQRAKFVGLTDL
jgi:predicted DCC family thiol-disulfide oxidoreductase YuxK